jgi:hypothetical protein
MKLKPYAAIVLTVFWFAGSVGNATEASKLSPRQNEIMRTTLAADGWLTEDMHREFWAQIPVADRWNPAEGMLLEQIVAEGLDFQRETWKSVMLSLQAGRVIRSPKYDAAKTSMLASPASAMLREQNATGIKNAESLMNAAANKSPVVTPGGTFYVTDELVGQTVAGLEAAHCRWQQLVNPSWEPKVEETKYSDAHVRILSECPFRREYRDITTESGKKARMTILFYAASQNNQLAVEFMATGGQFAVPQQSVAHIAQSALNAMGIVDVKPIISQWRGRTSSEASGSVVSSQGTIYASVRVADAPEHQGAWALLAVTSDSMIEAQARRNALETSTQLDTQ